MSCKLTTIQNSQPDFLTYQHNAMTPPQEQQKKARFFGMHIGCSVNVTGMAEYKNGGVTWDENGTFLFFDGFEHHLFDENCKLILRPISSITDEEAIECAKIAALKHYDKVLRFKDRIEVLCINR